MNQSLPPREIADLHRGPGPFASRRSRVALVSVCALLFLGLWLLPPFEPLHHSADWFPVWLHTVTECFSIIVSAMVFAVSWHAYRPERPSNFILLASGFLAATLLDVGHMMSYQGMPDFVTPASPQKAIAFWLCARVLAALAMLAIVFHAWRPFTDPRLRYRWLGAALALVAAIYVLQLYFPERWPRFFITGEGLTPIKLAIEGTAVAIMTVVALRLWLSRDIDRPYDVGGMLTAVLLWILSELSLMVYENVNDVFSLLGHVYKVLAYFLIYRLVFVASVREPYDRLAVEIADKQAAELQVEALAFYDVLTGLPNKALLRDRAGQNLAARAADGGQCGLLLLNVDGFKNINDSLGHAAGDAVLRAIAERLPHCVGEADTVSRLGGDEFAVLLREIPGAEAAAAAQERILEATSQSIPVAGQELRITVSIGAAIAPGDGRDFESLFQNAGTALHRAKDAGGHGGRFYSAAMNQEVAERMHLRNDLRRALERNEFVLHYQPQFDLHSGALVGIEALVRWQHPERGLVPPLRFIPEAEDSGLIVPIGQWILEEACRQAQAWRTEGVAIPVVAVNLSAKQFQRGDVEDAVRGALGHSGLPASALELELTESILVQDAQAVLETVRRLKALGVRLSIDDFGTGYSSLAYLRDFPVDKLKVDQSFVREMAARADGEAIVGTIIQLARSMRLQTIAEGVEDDAAAATLRRLGCEQAQGYLFARPLPAAELRAFLRSRSSPGV